MSLGGILLSIHVQKLCLQILDTFPVVNPSLLSHFVVYPSLIFAYMGQSDSLYYVDAVRIFNDAD